MVVGRLAATVVDARADHRPPERKLQEPSLDYVKSHRRRPRQLRQPEGSGRPTPDIGTRFASATGTLPQGVIGPD
jgi:hypothetical protein